MKNTIKRWMLRHAWACTFIASSVFWLLAVGLVMEVTRVIA